MSTPGAPRVVNGLIVLLALALLISGLSGQLGWLALLGYDGLQPFHPGYQRHLDFISPVLSAAGLLLLVMVLAQGLVIRWLVSWLHRPWPMLASLLVIMLLAMGLIAYVPFRNYPFSLDEYNYLYQARIFARGQLYLEFSERFAPFVEQYVIFTDGKLFSKYAPGFSALLSIGVLLDVAGLINPLIAIATLLVLFLFVRSFFGPAYGLLAVVLMATTPYFLAYSASYFSQPLALLLTGLILWLVRQYELTGKAFYLPLVGLVAGYAAMTRPLDCFCIIVPAYLYLMYLLHQRRVLIRLGYPIASFAVMFVLFLLYNFHLSGQISIATYPIVEGEFKVVDPESSGWLDNLVSIIGDYVSNGVEIIPLLLGEYLLIPAALFIPIAALVGVFVFRGPWRWLLLANVALLILLYNFHPGWGWPQYGARYYYSGFFALCFFAVAALRQLFQQIGSRQVCYAVLVVVLMAHTVFSVVAIWEYAYRFTVVEMVRDDIERECGEGDLVLLNTSAASDANSALLQQVNFFDLIDMRRNPFMDETRLVTRFPGQSGVRQLRADFPDHDICFYNYDVLRERG